MAPRVGLLVTCLVDLFRPEVAFAAMRLVTATGATVVVPRQSCCGQPAYNNGDRMGACLIARQVVAAFEGFDHVVVPSGSCAGMVTHHYPRLFQDDAEFGPRARRLAARCFELTQYLADVAPLQPPAGPPVTVVCHESCSGLRELGIGRQARTLLARAGATVVEIAAPEPCCGFGGTFCVKFPELSAAIADRTCRSLAATGADLVVGADLGCLLNIAGRFGHLGGGPPVRHIAELLDGPPTAPPIGRS